MGLASPLWLLALLPWTVTALWLLRGYRPTTIVPFLHLWPDDTPAPEQRRRWRLPSATLILLLSAALLGIFAAARPGLAMPGKLHPPALVVDRGITQLAGDRYAALARQTARVLAADCLPEALVDVRFVPGPSMRIPVQQLEKQLLDLPAWPVQTHDELPAAIAQSLAATGGPVLVLSDQALSPVSGTIQAASGVRTSNIGIESIAATDQPTPQVMVSVRNDSPATTADLSITSGGHVTTQRIALPARGQTIKVFVDLPGLGETVKARLGEADDLAADNAAFLTRQDRPARPKIRTTVPPELARLVDVYDRLHVLSTEAREVDVSTAPLASRTCGVQLVLVAGEASPAQWTVNAEHALLSHVKLPPAAAIATSGPGEGWTVLASIGDRPAVAVREGPTRQVWVGFWSAPWCREVDYVVFWTNLLNWLGGEQSQFTSQTVHALDEGWKTVSTATTGQSLTNPPANPSLTDLLPTVPAPREMPGLRPGLYRKDAAMVAINAPAPAELNPAGSTSSPAAAWPVALRQAMSRHPARRELAPWLGASAIILLLVVATIHTTRVSREEVSLHEPELTD